MNPWPGRDCRRLYPGKRDEPPVAKKRVLVLDDDPQILELIQIILEDEGHTVTTFTSPQEALAAVNTTPPDLVLLDIVMRSRHGLEVLSELREKVPNLPVVLLSGAVSQVDDMPEIARALGAQAFIEKPFDALQLVEVVESAQ
jgi:CheY-like chemotaxis protein